MLITPHIYFSVETRACLPAYNFCHKFPTMRDAWLSDAVEVEWMTWAVCRKGDNADAMLAFDAWLVEQIGGHNIPDVCHTRRPGSWGGCDELSNLYVYGIYGHGQHLYMDRTPEQKERFQRQRDKLRELIPDMFIGPTWQVLS